MASKTINHIYKFKRGKEGALFRNNPVLLSGEPIAVFCSDGKTRLKIGDGTTAYNDLQFVDSDASDKVNEILDIVNNFSSNGSGESSFVFKLSATEVEETSGNTLSSRISKYISTVYPTVKVDTGSIAILTDSLKSGQLMNTSLVFDGLDWHRLHTDIQPDNSTIERDSGVLSLLGFGTAENSSFPVKDEDGKFVWKSSAILDHPVKEIAIDDYLLDLKDGQLSTHIRLTLNPDSKELLLIGKDSRIINSIDMSKYLIDGFLTDVQYDADTNILHFKWNTDSGLVDTDVLMSDILDPYLPGYGIDINDSTISVKINPKSVRYIENTEDGIDISNYVETTDRFISNMNINLTATQDRVRDILESMDYEIIDGGRIGDGNTSN